MTFEQTKPMGMLQRSCGRGNTPFIVGRISIADLVFPALVLEMLARTRARARRMALRVQNQRWGGGKTDEDHPAGGSENPQRFDEQGTGSQQGELGGKADLVFGRSPISGSNLAFQNDNLEYQKRQPSGAHIHSHRHREGLGCARPLSHISIHSGGSSKSESSAPRRHWIMRVSEDQNGDSPRVYRLHLRPESDCDQAQIDRGLRWLLKRLLRTYRLRCFKIEEITDE